MNSQQNTNNCCKLILEIKVIYNYRSYLGLIYITVISYYLYNKLKLCLQVVHTINSIFLAHKNIQIYINNTSTWKEL